MYSGNGCNGSPKKRGHRPFGKCVCHAYATFFRTPKTTAHTHPGSCWGGCFLFKRRAGSRAGAEAARGAQPKASTERVSTWRSEPLTLTVATTLKRGVQGWVFPCNPARGERGVWGSAPRCLSLTDSLPGIGKML